MCSDGHRAEEQHSATIHLVNEENYVTGDITFDDEVTENENEINYVADEVTFDDEMSESDEYTSFMAQESLFERLSREPEHVVDSLKVVDIYRHDGVWVCLDEGCNKDATA